jgi:GDPmannose 4,6-dehydratase
MGNIKKALITGITGMDGSHMADLLLSKDYEVYGLERHKSVPNRLNVRHIEDKIHFVKGDLTDLGSLVSVLQEVRPDEVYNFASQSFVGDSWLFSEMTGNVTGLGVLRLLEAIRSVDKNIKMQQASSSEMFGNHGLGIVDENGPLHPRSPYGVAKIFGHLITQNFRESYGMFACSSICFNHESERRGFEFVTRKVSNGVARIKLGLQDKIVMGNLDAKRDWGYAPEYCEGIWAMLQQSEPQDYVFATGLAHSVRDFVQEAFMNIGVTDWEKYVEINPTFIRAAEVDYLLGDYSKAHNILGWEPSVRFRELVRRMVQNDIFLNQKEK